MDTLGKDKQCHTLITELSDLAGVDRESISVFAEFEPELHFTTATSAQIQQIVSLIWRCISGQYSLLLFFFCC